MNVEQKIYYCPCNEKWSRVQMHIMRKFYDVYDSNEMSILATIEEAVEACGLLSVLQQAVEWDYDLEDILR